LGCLVTVLPSEGFGLNRMSPPTLPPAKVVSHAVACSTEYYKRRE